MPSLALFDFDGTITAEDTFAPFIHFAVEPRRKAVGLPALAPIILAFKLGLVPATRMRALVTHVAFRGRRAVDIDRLGAEYAARRIPNWIRPEMIERIGWHKSQGDVIAVVSASLEPYLQAWCATHGLALICTRLETRDGIVTGRYLGGDCSGEEKARRVRERYDLATFSTIYAYGDTPEDEALLALAGRRYFRGREVS